LPFGGAHVRAAWFREQAFFVSRRATGKGYDIAALLYVGDDIV